MAATTQAKGHSETPLQEVRPHHPPNKVETLFLAADEVDMARAAPMEPVWRAVALFNGVARDSLPEHFFRSSSLEEAIAYLMGRTPSDTPRRRLFLNMRRTVEALKAGELAAFPSLFRPSKVASYDVHTLVDMEKFLDWALDALTSAGPWTPRGQSPTDGTGYWLKLTVRPARAHVVEDLDRQFGGDFYAGCPRGWDEIERYCREKHGLSKPAARELIRFMDPRAEHRGAPVPSKSKKLSA